MRGVSLDLRGATLMTLDDEPREVALGGDAGGEVKGVARRGLLGAPDEGDDLLVRLGAGGAEAGDGGRRADELHEAPATHAVVQLGSASGELTPGGRRQLGRSTELLDAAPVVTLLDHRGGGAVCDDRQRSEARLLFSARVRRLLVLVAAHR